MNKLLEVLGALFKTPNLEELAESLKKSDGTFDEDKAFELIKSEHAKQVATNKELQKTKFDDGYKKAQKEVLTPFEKKAKELFEVESDLQGEDLLSHIATTVKESSKGKKGELTDDDVKKHPVYLKAEKDFKKQLSDKETEKETALKTFKDEFTQKELFAKAKEAALVKFKKVGEAILPADAEKANKMIQRLLVDELAGFKYQVDADGKFVVLNADGTRAEDEHGHAIDFDSHVEKIAKSNFEFKAAKDRGAPGNGGSGGQGGGGNGGANKYTGKAPGSKEEYLGLLTGDLPSEQKMEIKQQYGEQFSKN